MEEVDAVAMKKRKRRLSLDQRIERQSQLLDEWLSTLTLAATKIRHYRKRVKTLERARIAAEQKHRPTRAIRVRD